MKSAIYQAINKLYQAIPVAPGQYGWLSYLLRDQWFRHPLNSVEIRRGYLLLDEMEHAVFFPQFFQDQEQDARSVQVEMMGGPIIEATANIEQGTWALRLGAPFVEWVDTVGGAPHDDLLIYAQDAVAGKYFLRLQPREVRQEEVISERNRQLVRAAEQIVSADRKSRAAVPVAELAAALVGRGLFKHQVPPDDMHYVLHEFSRLRLYDDLGYAFEESIPPIKRNFNRFQAQGRPSQGQIDVSEAPAWFDEDEDLDAWRQAYDVFGVNYDDFDDVSMMDSFIDDPDDAFWDVEDDPGMDDNASELCEGYQSYLSEFYNIESNEQPLSHMEFHLLEAELEMLVGLEQEFGYLMPEQEKRKL
ncbi:MAG: hypothetical protein KDD84_24385, partial [Caldilineaceae bacterium]|nr:hypothetical protein [Caldilineaceae bacterium]